MAERLTEKLSLVCDGVHSHRQLACCHSYCGIPQHGKEVLIYSTTDGQQKPLRLTGHHGDISAMTFGKGSRPVILCSASTDYIIVWDIELCKKRTQEGKVAAGKVIGTLLGEVVYLSFCFSDERVSACAGTTVYVLSSKARETICTLRGHLGPVTSAEFCPWNKDILVTSSENCTFRVWDLKTEAVFYQSCVLSASSLLSVFFLEKDRQLLTGSTDGQVWCFSLIDDHKCHLVTKMDLQKMDRRYQMHQYSVSHQAGCIKKLSVSEVEFAKPVLRLALCDSSTDANTDPKNDNSWFCIGSTDGLYVVDLATAELITVLYFKDYPDLSIATVGSWSISQGSDNSMVALVNSLFTPRVAVLEIHLCDLRRLLACDKGFSVFPSSVPLPNSPLNAELKKKEPNHPKRKGGVKEQPLVFHSKVKSSGYTSAPRRIMFSPKTNVQKSSSSREKTDRNPGSLLRDYPADSTAPTIPSIDVSIVNKPVLCLQYSDDGKQILCGLGDSTVQLYKSGLTGTPTVYTGKERIPNHVKHPFALDGGSASRTQSPQGGSKDKRTDLEVTGHDKSVSSVSWSFNGESWLSASEDLSLRIWTHRSSEPAIVMGEKMFSNPIRGAQFYYLNKFLLLASGTSLYLCLYNLDTTRDDIKRYQQRSVYKLARCFTASSATVVTALSAINDFFSDIVLVCRSNRSIQVFDMNKGTVASELPDTHSTAIHCITQNKGSAFSTQDPDSYNLFLTSAVTDGMKIWDLRTLRCVRRYDSHLNRCCPCSSAISPCGRFIATGSEDNCAYVYDIRSSAYLHKLQKHSDTVLNVTFNPATPQMCYELHYEAVIEGFPLPLIDCLRAELLSGTLDGKLRLFEPSSGSCLSLDTSAAVHSILNKTV